jgi:hypothetical protein
MPKLKVAALVVPTFVTVAMLPGDSVDVDPTLMVAAVPAAPILPFCASKAQSVVFKDGSVVLEFACRAM